MEPEKKNQSKDLEKQISEAIENLEADGQEFSPEDIKKLKEMASTAAEEGADLAVGLSTAFTKAALKKFWPYLLLLGVVVLAGLSGLVYVIALIIKTVAAG